MQHLPRVFLVTSLVLGSLVLGSSSSSAADKKKWPGKKHHATHHKSSKPAAKASGAATKTAGAADGKDEEAGESAEGDDKADDDAKPARASSKKGQAASADSDGEEREASRREGGDEEGDCDGTVVRRKAKKVTMEADEGAPVAFELSAGPRLIHRSFDFHDPLSNYNPAAQKPYAYVLPAGPAPFVDLALYPAAFATRGFASNLGLVASYERLVGTQTQSPNGTTFDTLAQQLEVGVRGRVPLAEHEIGIKAAYGKQTFHVSETDPGPSSGTVPNVDYTFASLGADARLRFSGLELGAHVGTRLVFDTGPLGKQWFSTVKTGSIDAGVSLAYRLTPMFSVVGGADLVRYGFDFNPVSRTNPLIVGGAVDQYISGFLALRVTVNGS